MSTPKAETDPSPSNPTTPLPASRINIMSNPSRIPPRSCFQKAVIVEVGVDVDKKAFTVHKDLLVFYSDYFRGAFNGSFSEAAEGKISLADVRVDVFEVVNQFIYTRQLSDEIDSNLDWEILVRAWFFGDKYLMPSLQNRVMSMLLKKHMIAKITPTHTMKSIYANTLPGSPLRKLIVDLTAYTLDLERSITPEKSKNWPHEALIDLVRAVGTKKKEDMGNYSLPEANKAKCYYHIHAGGESCDTVS